LSYHLVDLAAVISRRSIVRRAVRPSGRSSLSPNHYTVVTIPSSRFCRHASLPQSCTIRSFAGSRCSLVAVLTIAAPSVHLVARRSSLSPNHQIVIAIPSLCITPAVLCRSLIRGQPLLTRGRSHDRYAVCPSGRSSLSPNHHIVIAIPPSHIAPAVLRRSGSRSHSHDRHAIRPSSRSSLSPIIIAIPSSRIAPTVLCHSLVRHHRIIVPQLQPFS